MTDTTKEPYLWMPEEAALAKAIMETIPSAYALCRCTNSHITNPGFSSVDDVTLVLIHGEESQTLFTPMYFPSLRPNEQVSLGYIISHAKEVDHDRETRV